MLKKYPSKPYPVKSTSRNFLLHLLSTAIILTLSEFSADVPECHAAYLPKSLLNSKLMNSTQSSKTALFLSLESNKNEETSQNESHIFRTSFQGPPYLLEPRLKNNLLARLWRDFDIQAKTPFQFVRKHPVRFGLVVAGLGTLIATDHATLSFLAPQHELQEKELVKVGKQLSKYGETIYAIPIIGGFGIYGWLARSTKEKETFRMLTEALVTSATWTGLLKTAAGRERPFEGEDSDNDWVGPLGIFSSENDMRGKQFASFPSGHSSAMFSLATILAHQYPKHYIVPVLSYTIATSVAYSRMVVDAHWFSDIVAGSALGYLCARQVIRDNREPQPKDSSLSALSVSFNTSGDYYGIRLLLRY